MAKPFNAAAFRENFGKPASTNFFLIELVPPVFMQGGGTVMTNTFDTLSYHAVAADLPTIEVDTVLRQYNGPARQIPIGHIHPTTVVEFMESEDGIVRAMFDGWIQKIFDINAAYKVPFYDDLVAPSMLITQYKRDGEKLCQYEFTDVFPRSIAPTQMNWTQNETPLIVPIEMSYHKWQRII